MALAGVGVVSQSSPPPALPLELLLEPPPEPELPLDPPLEVLPLPLEPLLAPLPDPLPLPDELLPPPLPPLELPPAPAEGSTGLVELRQAGRPRHPMRKEGSVRKGLSTGPPEASPP